MATISKRRGNEASILSSFSLSKRNEPAYSRSSKDRGEANHAYSTPQKVEAKRTLFIPQNAKSAAKRSLFIPQIAKSEAKKTNWIEVKRTEAVFLKLFWSPGIDSKELILPAYALAGLYNKLGFQPPQIALKLLKSLQIRAQATLDSGIGSLESINK